jgi:hypothetical protein
MIWNRLRRRAASRFVSASVHPSVFFAKMSAISYGFRPGKWVHAALERMPRAHASEEGRSDDIDRHGLMQRVRRRVGDAKTILFVRSVLVPGRRAFPEVGGTRRTGDRDGSVVKAARHVVRAAGKAGRLDRIMEGLDRIMEGLDGSTEGDDGIV